MNKNEEFAIRGSGISKVFKDFWGRDRVAALTDVEIEVRRGCVFGLLGPNGAGKSTLIKLILGHLFPSRGRLSVLGQDPRDVAVKQHLGYLPERSSLYRNLTAAETLSFFGKLLGLTQEQIKERTRQLLGMVGLEGAANRTLGEFSHGMSRRLGLAQALLNDPDLLILDEPTAGLDPVGCREVKDLVITLGKRGKTILMTSHLLADVEDVCDEIMLLFGGRVQAKGAIDNLLRDEGRMRLEFPAVSPETLEKVKTALQPQVNPADIQCTNPADSLEDYFLRIVAESNANKQATHGVRMGKGVAAYLRDGEKAESADIAMDTEAIQRLAAGTPAPETAPPAEAETAAKPDQEALEKLVAPTSSDAGENGTDDELDRETLDKLTR